MFGTLFKATTISCTLPVLPFWNVTSFIIGVRVSLLLTSSRSCICFFTVAVFLTISLHVPLLLASSTVCVSILSPSNSALILTWPVKIELWLPHAHMRRRARAHTHTHRPCIVRAGILLPRNLEDSTVKYSHYGKKCSVLRHLLLRSALALRSEFQMCLSIVSFCFFFTRCLFLETSACRLNAPWREIS